MALSVKQLLRRRGAAVALVTSALVGGGYLVSQVLQLLLRSVPSGAVIWDLLPDQVLFVTLPFVLGVFLCLWLLLPINGELELRFVVTRALGAALLGSVLVFVAKSVQLTVLLAMQTTPQVVLDNLGALLLGQALSAGIFLVVFAVPLVVIFAIFQWNWLKHHPAEFEVAGILDV